MLCDNLEGWDGVGGGRGVQEGGDMCTPVADAGRTNTALESRVNLEFKKKKKNLPANAVNIGSIPVWEDSTCHGAPKPVHHNN